MKEFKKILRNMKPVDYIRIGHWTFWKTKRGKFCVDGEPIGKAMTQKNICWLYRNYIENKDYYLI